MRLTKKIALVSMAILFSAPSFAASDWVKVNDMSELKYEIVNGKVWLRNMNQFKSTWQACCYAYYVDLQTSEGQAQWSAMLAQMAMKGSFNIGVDDVDAPGTKVKFAGKW